MQHNDGGKRQRGRFGTQLIGRILAKRREKPLVLLTPLPDSLVHQALAIAQKVSRMLLSKKSKGLVGKKTLKNSNQPMLDSYSLTVLQLKIWHTQPPSYII